MSNTGFINLMFGKPISFYSFFDITKNAALKLFFYRGYSISFPLPTGSVYDHNHAKISAANLALEYYNQYGIYEKLAKDWIYWNMNIRKDCKAMIVWPVKYLYDFDWTKKYIIQGNQYLVKANEFEIYYDETIKFDLPELAKC